MDAIQQLKVLNVCSIGVGAYCLYKILDSDSDYSYGHLLGAFLSILSCGTTRYVLTKRPSRTQSWTSLLSGMLMVLGGPRKCKQIYTNMFLEPSKQDMEEVQKQYLLDMLKKYAKTRFCQDHGLGEVTSVEEFRNKVELNTFSSMQPYMDAAGRGEENVTFPGKVEFLAKSSGTTGKNKTFPLQIAIVMESFQAVNAFNYMLSQKNFRRTVAPKGAIRFYAPKRLNEHGLVVGSLTQLAENARLTRFILSNFTAPQELSKMVITEEKSLYLNVLFAIREHHVDFVEAFFPSNLLSFIQCMESNWPSLCDAIELGELPDSFDIAQPHRFAINKTLLKDPRRAAQLRAIFEMGTENIIRKLWPDINYVSLVASGSFKTIYDYVKNKYLQDVDTGAPAVVGTEGLTGVNITDLNMENPVYTVSPKSAFFEFIPVEHADEEQPDTVLLHQVQLGRMYEVVTTNLNGMYRQRIGDCVQFVSYFGNIPQFNMVQRLGQGMNIKNEKVDEGVFNKALFSAFHKLSGKKLIEYTCAEILFYYNCTGEKGANDQYCVFVELEYEGDSRLSEEDCALIDEELMSLHENYRLFRVDKRIRPMRIVELKKGAFYQFKLFVRSLNVDTSALQYKTPRVLKLQNHVQFIVDNLRL